MALSACMPSGLQFRQDLRVEIVAPADRAEVTLPVVIDWEIDEELAAALADPSQEPAGFAVLLDVEPQPVGAPLAHFAAADRSCRPADGCPDLDYLAARRIFTTRATEFRFETVSPVAGVDLARGDRDVHRVTIVLLDEPGNRIGESAWTVSFEIMHPEPT